jgi:hypothetical protein
MLSHLALALAFAASAQSATSAPFVHVETGRGYDRLQEAVDAIGGRAGTIRIASGRHGDCAVQEAGRIAFVAAERGAAVLDGGACEGKATLVLRGRAALVDGLVFLNVQVADGNGAGIRLEQGDLDVAYTRFAQSQCGILTANDPAGSISIRHSTFSGLGNRHADDGVHSIYVGGYGALSVANSRFERGTSGHYLKSRAPRIEVLDSSFDDSHGRSTNYLIDLPGGAVGRIAGNVFVQGVGKENYGTMIAVAAEDGGHRSAGLTIEDNQASVAPGFRWQTSFVGDWSGQELVVRNNRIGPRITLLERH